MYQDIVLELHGIESQDPESRASILEKAAAAKERVNYYRSAHHRAQAAGIA
jgi:hypothetical protein